MQGTFSPLEASARRHMRRNGIANPMDDGAEYDSTTGQLPTASSIRKRTRNQILGARAGGVSMGARRKGRGLVPGFPKATADGVDMAESERFIKESYKDSEKLKKAPSDSEKDFWEAYVLENNKFMYYTGDDELQMNTLVEEVQVIQEAKLECERLMKGELWMKQDRTTEKWEVKGNMGSMITDMISTVELRVLDRSNMDFQWTYLNERKEMLEKIKKNEGGDEKGNVLLDVVPESVKELVLFGIKPLFTFKPLLGRVAMHIIRWPPVFSISDQAFADLVDLLASTSELDIIMYFKAIMQVGIENKDCANSCVELLGSILTCQKLYAKLEEQFSDPDEKRIALGMAAKETLLSFRNKVFGLWGDGNNKEDFFNMGLTEWLDGMWDLKNIYRSREVVEGCIKTHFYESIKTWAAPDEEKTACWKKIEKRMDVQEDHQVFVDEILDIIKPDVLHLTAYREIMTRDEIFYSDFRRAQQLDCYYSGLVKGAGVRIGTDRVWAAPDVPAPDVLDEKNFVDVVWKVIKEMHPEWSIHNKRLTAEGRSSRTNSQHALEIVRRMKDLRDCMINIWNESKMYRITDVVHMIEVQVLQRLKRDGLIPWFDEPGRTVLSVLEICNWFRRNDQLRTQFASTVGKRMVTESLVSTSNSNIMNHQRTASWSEREYMTLHERVSSMSQVIEQACVTQDVLRRRELQYLDYLNIQTRNIPRERVENAVDSVRMRHLR